MTTKVARLSLMAIVVFSLVFSSMVLANTIEIRELGAQDAGVDSYLNSDFSVNRSAIPDFDPDYIGYAFTGDFTDTWIDSDKIGDCYTASLKFTVPGFTFSEIESAYFQVNFAGFETVNKYTPRMGISNGGNIHHAWELTPDKDGGYVTQKLWIDLDCLVGGITARELFGEEYITFSLNFLKWVGFAGEGVIDNIQIIARGNNNVPGSGSTVPEPATFLLFGVGLLGIAGFTRKQS